MALSQKHRSTIYQRLEPILGKEEAEALLSQFPDHDLDQVPVADLADRSPGERLGGHVPDACAGRYTAESRVGDDRDDVLDHPANRGFRALGRVGGCPRRDPGERQRPSGRAGSERDQGGVAVVVALVWPSHQAPAFG